MRARVCETVWSAKWLMTNLVAPPLMGDGHLTAVGGKPRRYRNSKNSPTKVGAHVFRHQLRVKTRSMKGFGCVINCGLKSVA